MNALEWSQHFSHYKSRGIFPDARAANSEVQGPIWRNFEPIWDLMVVLVTCKNEEDSIKNKGARAVTTLFIDFSDTQGQLTL